MSRTRRDVKIKRLLFVAVLFFVLVGMTEDAFQAGENTSPDLDQDWFVTTGEFDESRPFEGVSAVGRVMRVDEKGFDTEDRVEGTEKHYERLPGTSILLKRAVDLERTIELCREVRSLSRFDDHVWLSNGDDFPCEVLGLDKRFVYLRAFDVDVRAPRGKVAAIRFRDVPAPVKTQ